MLTKTSTAPRAERGTKPNSEVFQGLSKDGALPREAFECR